MHWTILSGGIRVPHDDSYNICAKSDADEWGERHAKILSAVSARHSASLDTDVVINVDIVTSAPISH